MTLKKHLHFTGDPEHKEITFHYVKGFNEDMVIEVDDYEKIWEYLCILSDQENKEKLDKWMKTYNVDKSELEEINNFLLTTGMVYETTSYKKNDRAVNFLNSYIEVKDNGEVISKIEKKRVLVIGLGTVGTAVIAGLQQIGVNQFVLVDNDLVDSRNIFHQRNFFASDIGQSKCKTVKKRLKEIDKNCEVIIHETFIDNINTIKDIVEENKVDVVFCCFDKHTSAFLQEIYEFLHTRKIPVYLSGYIMSMVKAYKLEDEIIREEVQFEKTHKDVITDNSGIGMLGDIAALLMIRLWLQTIDIKFDLNVTSLEYDFLQPSMNEKVYLQGLDDIEYNGTQNKYQQDEIIFPYMLMKYVRYLQGERQELEQINRYCSQNEIEFFDDTEDEIELYQNFIDSFCMNYNGKNVSIAEFSEIALRDDIQEESFQEYILQQQQIVDYAIKCIQKKKQKYYKEYLKVWDNKAALNKALLTLAQKMAKERYVSEMDFLQYKPFKKNQYSLSKHEEIEMVKNMDKYNLYTDYTGFVDYCLEHNFLHIKNSNENSLCVMNPRYGTSDIIVSKNNNWQDVFSMAHEIGHGYYNSFLPKGVTGLDEVTSEVFSMLTEYRLIKTLFNNKMETFQNVIKDRIQAVIIGMYSLDLYEKEILGLKEITYEHIMEVRKKINRQIFKEIKLKNEEYSRYNMFMNAEMVVAQRNVYLYPEAMLIGFDLGKRIEENSEIELKLVHFLKQNFDGKNIYQFYNEIGIEKMDYFDMINHMWELWMNISHV